MFAAEHDVVTPDGRTLRVHEAGTEGGRAVVWHAGTPGGRTLYPRFVELAAERGARLIGYDRPGYGGSDPDPGRTVADATGDVLAVAEALDFGRFVTLGVSGGGPHALACAALLGDRLAAAAALASLAPSSAPGLDFTAGMGEGNVAEFGKALAGRAELQPFVDELRPELLASTPEEVGVVLASILSPPDLEVFDGAVAKHMVRMMRSALERSGEGWIEDDLAFTADWGFSLADIRVPVLLLQGEQDLMVPRDHGRWLAQAIPGVDARLLPDDGHLTLAHRRMPEILDWLLERL